MDYFCNVTTIIYVVYLAVHISNCAPLTDGNGISPDELNGNLLEKLGVKLKLPKLQLLGRTIENVEKKIEKICDLHSCAEWTAWQGCDARLGEFGSKFRTRQCGDKTSLCDVNINNRTEKESGICVGVCPNDYNITKNGFCLKLYADLGRSYDTAEQQCKKDGGHLVNIDNEVKYGDVNSMLQGFSKTVRVNGRRKDVSSPWEFTYGSQKSFFKWCSSCPHNGTHQLCLIAYLSSGSVIIDDYTCSVLLYSLCEITQAI